MWCSVCDSVVWCGIVHVEWCGTGYMLLHCVYILLHCVYVVGFCIWCAIVCCVLCVVYCEVMYMVCHSVCSMVYVNVKQCGVVRWCGKRSRGWEEFD